MAIHRFWSTLFRIKSNRGKIENGWTLHVLTIVHFWIGICAVVEYFLIAGELNYVISLIGLIMFSIALLGRTWAENTLGKYHSAQIEIREDQPLITSGPYKYVRHPIYFFILIEILGFPLIANAYYAFALSFFLYIPLLLLRLHLEEKVLTEKFGTAYIQYKSAIPCLIPFTKRPHEAFAERNNNVP
jgi:protein-S-isoprenylcysteine O-methyltransferase Ste14